MEEKSQEESLTQAQSGATSLLARSVGTFFAGPRGKIARRSFGVIVSLSGAALAASLATHAIGETVPAAQAPAAEHSPSQSSLDDPRDIQLKWLSLPSSPFLEVGRNPDGTFSIDRMARAWVAAGLQDTQDIRRAALYTNMLRPTLMTRDDPQLEVQLLSEAGASVGHLEKRFPQVHARLLSGDFDAQSVPSDHPSLGTIESLVLNPLPARDLGLQSRVKQALEWNQSRPPGLSPLEIPRLLEPGLQGKELDLPVLVDAWRQAGMGPSQVMTALRMTKQALPDMEGKSTQQVKRAHEEAIQAHDRLKQMFPQPLGGLGADPHSRFPPATGGWEQEEWEALWENVHAYVQRDGVNPSTPEHLTMEQALEALQKTALETGLKSLSPALSDWRSPRAIHQAASRLEQANEELEAITGWEGEVLGFGGRLELSLGPPSLMGGFGVATMDPSRRPQVIGTWSALGHEWFHIYDYFLNRQVSQSNALGTLSEGMEIHANPVEKVVFEGMRDLKDAAQGASQWQDSLAAADARRKAEYWSTPSEMLAFGFDAMASNIYGATALGDPEGVYSGAYGDPVRHAAATPSQGELRALRKSYEGLFKASEHLGLSQSQLPEVSTDVRYSTSLQEDQATVAIQSMDLSQWREHRKEVEEKMASQPSQRRGLRFPTVR